MFSTKEEKYIEALENLEHARKVAAKEGFTNELKRIQCLIGMAKGAMGFAAYADKLVSDVLLNEI